MLFVTKHVIKTVCCLDGKMTCWCSWPLQGAFFINPTWELPLLTHALYTNIQRTHAYAIIKEKVSVTFQMSLLPPFYASYFCFSQVANLACSISNNEEGVKLVRMAATQIDSLCPQVRKFLYSTTSQINWMLFIHTNRLLQKKTTDDRATNMASWMEGIESH